MNNHCLKCGSTNIALLFVQVSQRILEENNDIAYCYDCEKIVEIDKKLKDKTLGDKS